MFNKKISLLFAVAVLTGTLAFAPLVFAAPPGSSQLKIFSRDRETIESAVNEWLADQKNIEVDQIKASAYGNEYAILISYRGGGGGRVLTRVKIFDSNALSGGAGGNDKTPETRGQEFVSLLGENQIIRFADILAGSGPWDIFVVYDEYNPITSLTSEAPSVSIIEKIKTFVENLVSPSPELSPVAEPSPEESAAPAVETPIVPGTATSTSAAEQGEAASSSTATTTPSAEETILAPQGEATSSPSEITPQASKVNSFLATVGLLSLGTDNMFVAIVIVMGILLLLAFNLFQKNKKKKTKR